MDTTETIIIPDTLKGGQKITVTLTHTREGDIHKMSIQSIVDDTTGEDITDKFSDREKMHYCCSAIDIANQ